MDDIITRDRYDGKLYSRSGHYPEYFDSYENCYPLISEYSYFLEDEVNELGIETEGKSKRELVEEVYEKKGRGKGSV